MPTSSLDKDGDAHNDALISAPHRSAQPGDVLTFGTYPQTAGGDGP